MIDPEAVAEFVREDGLSSAFREGEEIDRVDADFAMLDEAAAVGDVRLDRGVEGGSPSSGVSLSLPAGASSEVAFDWVAQGVEGPSGTYQLLIQKQRVRSGCSWCSTSRAVVCPRLR